MQADGLSDSVLARSIDSHEDSFLCDVSPRITKSFVDFKRAGLDEYDGLYAVVLNDVLTSDECRKLVQLAENSTKPSTGNPPAIWERAMVNVGGGMQVMTEDIRKCGRIIMDSQSIVDQLWERVNPYLQELLELSSSPNITGEGPAKRREVWRLTRLNERMRFLRYTQGEYFKPHQDGMYETRDKKERTYFTLHLYLNENTEDEPLTGGATTFHSVRGHEAKLDVQPRMGSVLVFQQRWLYHAGSEVHSGTKLTMRTELLYEKSDDLGPSYVSCDDAGLDHRNVSIKSTKRARVPWVKNKLSRKS